MVITIACYLLMGLVTVVYCLLAVFPLAIAILFCGFSRKRIGNIMRFFILWYGRAVVRIALRPFAGVEFEDRSPEQNGGIFICNHRSASDPFLVSSVVLRRSPAQVVNRWPMRLPFFGFFARIGEYLDITSMNYEQAKERAAYLLEQHVPLFVFPEGTRSGSREMNQFHGTFFRIAKELSCPLIPVAITGNERIPSRNYRITCGRIRIRKLSPVPMEVIAELPPFQLKPQKWMRRVAHEDLPFQIRTVTGFPAAGGTARHADSDPAGTSSVLLAVFPLLQAAFRKSRLEQVHT